MKWINNNYKLYINGKIFKRASCGKEFKEVKQYDCNGYKTIYIEGRMKYVHRVMWEIYKGEIPKGYEIDHINNKRNNNHINNLRCITKSENTRKSALRSWKRKVLKHTTLRKKIRATWKQDGNKKTRIFKSITLASEKLKVPKQSIVDNLKGRTKRTRGLYNFEYI